MRKLLAVCLMVLALGCHKNRKPEYTVDQLVTVLQDENPDMRYWAASSLGARGVEARSAAPALLERLNDPSGQVRMGAAYALGEIRPEARIAVPALQQRLRDEDASVREAATYALKKIQAQ